MKQRNNYWNNCCTCTVGSEDSTKLTWSLLFLLSPDNVVSMLQIAIELGHHLPVPTAWTEDWGFSSSRQPGSVASCILALVWCSYSAVY